MQRAYEQLAEFSRACDVKRTGALKKPFSYRTLEERVELLELRKALIVEEYKETIEALEEFTDSCIGIYNSQTKEHLTKELCDLIYVCVGAAVEFGIDLPKAFKRVHDNNMLKIKTATIREDGKLVKAANHPLVELGDCI